MRNLTVSDDEYLLLSELRKKLGVRTARQAMTYVAKVVAFLIEMQRQSDLQLILFDGEHALRVIMQNDFGRLQEIAAEAGYVVAEED